MYLPWWVSCFFFFFFPFFISYLVILFFKAQQEILQAIYFFLEQSMKLGPYILFYFIDIGLHYTHVHRFQITERIKHSGCMYKQKDLYQNPKTWQPVMSSCFKQKRKQEYFLECAISFVINIFISLRSDKPGGIMFAFKDGYTTDPGTVRLNIVQYN